MLYTYLQRILQLSDMQRTCVFCASWSTFVWADDVTAVRFEVRIVLEKEVIANLSQQPGRMLRVPLGLIDPQQTLFSWHDALFVVLYLTAECLAPPLSLSMYLYWYPPLLFHTVVSFLPPRAT